MANDAIRVKGVVTEVLRDTHFIVQLNESGAMKDLKITCTISGKLRQNNIRIIAGDTVDVDISPYNLTRGRIAWRYTSFTQANLYGKKKNKKNKK